MRILNNIIDFDDRLIPRRQWWDNWEELRDDLHYQWELLTGEDMEKIRNDRDQISNILQNRYGFNDQQAVKAVDNFFKYQRYNVQLE
jgi:hypothetical protein